MRHLSRSARVLGAIVLVLLACVAVGQMFVYRPANEGAAEARPAPTQVTTRAQAHDSAGPQQTIAQIPMPPARPKRAPAGIDAFSLPSQVAPTPLARKSAPPSVAAPQPVAPPPSPYSIVGYFEDGGVKMAVLARGDRILLKKQGDDVGNEFRLVGVDPPALLHLQTGTVLPVRRQVETVLASSAAPRIAALLASDSIIAGTVRTPPPAEASDAAEIEADIARALAAPVPAPNVQSSFPLAR